MSHFVLVDCNNFYVSCERLFNPGLEGRPVIVLSNNDGCVIARSQEAKQLGIKMGDPYFQIKEFCNRMKISVFSSNYKLYGEISRRVMNILASSTEEIEFYSIDEAFLIFSADMASESLFRFCVELRSKIKKWVGIPVSIGIAPTKTLAKIANGCVKKERLSGGGVVDLSSPATQKEVLQKTPLQEIWGIGSRLAQRLHAMGIQTAWEFREMEPTLIRKKMGVFGERTLRELRGVSCLPLEKSVPRKSITYSRSFGKIVEDPLELGEALSTFAAGACVKLRKQKCCAQALSVFLESILDAREGTRRHFTTEVSFLQATNDTSEIITAAKECLMKLFSQEERYKKCGIVLLDLISEEQLLPDLFLAPIDPKRRKLMTALDALNGRYGKKALFYGAEGISPTWKIRSSYSSHYGAEWEGLVVVLAK